MISARVGTEILTEDLLAASDNALKNTFGRARDAEHDFVDVVSAND